MAKKREQPEDRAVYIISVAAELAGVHPQTLRIYERKGLLRPARTPGNTRRYSARDIARLQMIQKLTQEQGLNLAGVKMIVEMEDQLDRMRRRMEALDRDFRKTRDRMLEEMERLRSQSRRGEIVPLSSVRRVQIQVERAKVARAPRRSGPIAVGPGSN
ncbi:MAG TPA: helix-turn-helix transcriptional regulator [Actinomycetota bacterium]|jgi:MerR family transcriptional regulator/heat shock protein HspR|nr:helix-turn-helix transcriptional regulator [Actinomycetota bacterium]